ncbi:carboxymuconolactone decarboxylase family protein [Streptomyces sp. NPDC047002]|uniref:carboxymuconolactone decarboxylase family protein n=1 Tax=Streptomyces sp. NPDC047002 TaxID=3155475 RepID=UPI00345200C1
MPGPAVVRHVTPVPAATAAGVVAEVYEQSTREIGRLVEAVTMFSPDPVLLAATWAGFREPLMAAGRAPRVGKEAVAATVSKLNECPFCVDAHTIMLYGGGAADFAAQLLGGKAMDPAAGAHAALARWAQDVSVAAGAAVPPPFAPEEAPEYLGVLVYFHFLNRVINVLLNGSFLPGPERARQIARRVGGKVMAKNVAAVNAPGEAVGLTVPPEAALPPDLAWAAGSPPIAAALAWLAAAVDKAASGVVPAPVRDLVAAAVDDWRGEPPPVSSSWTDEPVERLPGELRPTARLALLAALAPHQVSDRDVDAFRTTRPGDAPLIALLCWSALTAARRVGTWAAASLPAARRSA